MLRYNQRGGFQSKACTHYAMPNEHRPSTGHWWKIVKKTAREQVRITYPTFAPIQVTHETPAHQINVYQQSWEVTYYTDVGLMADGAETHWGAAACGYDVPFFTRVYVPGVGMLTCEDRIGFNPWHHIDVWGVRPGLGNDYRTVTVYP